MWIPQKNEDGERPQDRKPQKTPRPQKADRLGFTFPKTCRILTRNHFQKMIREGRRFAGTVVSFQYVRGARHPRLGISVSKKYGKAHERNRFKRVVREAFRQLYAEIPSDMHLHVLPRGTFAPISKQMIVQDLQALITSKQAPL